MGARLEVALPINIKDSRDATQSVTPVKKQIIMKNLTPFLLILLMAVSFSCSTGKEKNLKVNTLECEYLSNPLGIDVATPRISWKTVADYDGMKQNAYRILVASDMEKLDKNIGDLWDSDTVYSDKSNQIVYAGKPLKSREKVFWKVRVWDTDGNVSPWSEAASLETAFLHSSDWKAKWIGYKYKEKIKVGQKKPAIYLRKEFEVKNMPEKARAYISGLGYYELYINGKKVGDHVLSPNQSNYDRMQSSSISKGISLEGSDLSHFKQRVYYETLDITDYLQEGKNVAVVILGSGWYMRTETEEYLHLTYGHPRMIAQFEIGSSRGDTQTIVSDESWKLTVDGPITDNSITHGEVYDARLEDPAWYKPGFDDSKWINAKAVRPPLGKLDAQMSPPDRVTKIIMPVSVKEVRDGVYKYDFGTMFSGWVQLKKQGKRGEKIVMKFFEDHGNNYGQRDVYIFKGEGVEKWEPRFTWHAFRYVEVSGSSGPMKLEDLTGKVVHTDVKRAGEFASSNELFNEIEEDYVKTQLDNMHGGVPSDCPHRERRGYTGDGQIAAQAAIYNHDMRAFYAKWLNDIADAQNTVNGYVPNTAPYHSGGGGVAWGSAYVLIPWYMYFYYGDETVLAKHYSGMKRYVDYLTNRTYKGGLIYIRPEDVWDLGEWVPPGTIDIPREFVATAYYYYDLTLLSKIADVIGKNDDAAHLRQLAEKTKDAFNKNYFNKEKNSYSIGRQGANVFPLAFGLVPEGSVEDVFNTLVKHIENETNGHFDTGMMATPYLLEVLTKYGRADLAYTMMNQRDFPSYGYNILRGATTLWETWTGKESHSHPMFGSVCAWFFQGLGGIMPDEKEPGFKHIIVKPAFLNRLDSVVVRYNSVYGEIVNTWRLSGDDIVMQLEVPANTTATVYIPAKSEKSVSVDKSIADSRGVRDGMAIYEVPSGEYVFVSKDVKDMLKSPMLAAPVIEPADTTVFKPSTVKVNIKNYEKNAEVRYTLDGTEPVEASELFTYPFIVDNSVTVKARVFSPGAKPSSSDRSNIVFIDKDKNGIKYKYYQGKWRGIPDFNRLKAERTGKTYTFSLDGIDDLSDAFGLVMTTNLFIEKGGEYTFTLNSNDGSKLFIDGKLIVNSDGLHGFMEEKGKVNLSKGMHKVRLEYFQAGGGRGLELLYRGPGVEEQYVPANVLFE